MKPSPAVVARLTAIGTIASAIVALLGVLAARGDMRLVDVLSIFFGGFGAGAGVVALVVQRRARRDAAGRATPAPHHGPPLHTPPTVPWRRE